MDIAWGSLGIVVVVALAVGVVVVVLVSLALVGLSARTTASVGGPEDGSTQQRLSAGAGTGIAAICLLAVLAIVVYGLYLIIA
jgi:ABC-type nickel/cobalt efflux system permease component RcnA